MVKVYLGHIFLVKSFLHSETPRKGKKNYQRKLSLSSKSNFICTYLFTFLIKEVYKTDFDNMFKCIMLKIKNRIFNRCLVSLCFSKNYIENFRRKYSVSQLHCCHTVSVIFIILEHKYDIHSNGRYGYI